MSCFVRSNFSSLFSKLKKKKSMYQHFILFLVTWDRFSLEWESTRWFLMWVSCRWSGYHSMWCPLIFRYENRPENHRVSTLCNDTHPTLVRCLAIWPRKNLNPLTYLGFYQCLLHNIGYKVNCFPSPTHVNWKNWTIRGDWLFI